MPLARSLQACSHEELDGRGIRVKLKPVDRCLRSAIHWKRKEGREGGGWWSQNIVGWGRGADCQGHWRDASSNGRERHCRGHFTYPQPPLWCHSDVAVQFHRQKVIHPHTKLHAPRPPPSKSHEFKRGLGLVFTVKPRSPHRSHINDRGQAGQ